MLREPPFVYVALSTWARLKRNLTMGTEGRQISLGPFKVVYDTLSSSTARVDCFKLIYEIIYVISNNACGH